jgi:hypothetical protein
VTIDTTCCDAPETTSAEIDGVAGDSGASGVSGDGELQGWQALAVASLGRLLTDAELAAVERLPTELALDLLFPDLPDAARHEALWALA